MLSPPGHESVQAASNVMDECERCFFAVDMGIALLLLVSGVCLWDSCLLVTVRLETAGVQTG